MNAALRSMLTADADTFVSDFGVPVEGNGRVTSGLLDVRDEIKSDGAGMPVTVAVSTLTVVAGALGALTAVLKNKRVDIDGVRYDIRRVVPMVPDDVHDVFEVAKA